MIKWLRYLDCSKKEKQMKVLISADIEGITTTTTWDETSSSHGSYAPHAKQMTDEVLACIEGIKKAGVTEILVVDAHGSGTNIDPLRMPSGVTLLRGYTGHPYNMVEGVDKTFEAAMFVGYHSSASRLGNPLSHTITLRCNYIKINGVIASEFLLYSYACALEGVPTVFLSGDKMLCEDFSDLHPKLITCPVKEGIGGMTMSYSPVDTIKNISNLSYKALSQDLKNALVKLPEHFDVELHYKEHSNAVRASFFPGVTRISDCVVAFKSDCFYEVLQAIKWIV
jgi:D-amino peptidase